MLGNHTAKHTEKIWSSILTDLSIGQVLMKSPKERGGVIRKEMTDVLRVWTKTMHRCEKISECLNDITSATYERQTHKEMQPGRIKRDNIAKQKSSPGFVYSIHLHMVSILCV